MTIDSITLPIMDYSSDSIYKTGISESTLDNINWEEWEYTFPSYNLTMELNMYFQKPKELENINQ